MDSALALRDSILENLHSRAWRAGHRIPTERELSDQFGLSRSAVRRVLADMKDKRLITQTVGSGTYVSEQVNEALAAAANSAGALPTSPAELMSARFVLEPAIVAMVVGNATSLDFARMNECCDRGEAARGLAQFELWDGLLHEAIADAAHNSFISKVFRLMNQVRAQGEWGALKRQSASPERRLEYQQEHRALVNALQDRDGVRATELCLAHLSHVRRNLLGY
ncbi:MAG: FCD domain-containing protein [Burkholderiaceae bacterium]